MKWEYLRSDEMVAAIERSGGLCVLPLGCTEKHGPHLPLGTDSLKATRCVEEAAERADVVVFPTGMWLGDMTIYRHEDVAANRGDVILSPKTLLTVLEELCDEIARNGFRKILIVSSHGGNTAMLKFFMRAQGYAGKKYATMWTPHRTREEWPEKSPYLYFLEHRPEYPMLTDEDMEVLKGYYENGGFGGGHADFSETANIMGYYPELIAEDRYEVESGSSTHRSDYLSAEQIECVGNWITNYPNAYDGKPPYGCSQTIGEAMNECHTRRLERIFKMLKADEECIKIAQGNK